jgi:hypothetical protein
MTIVKQLNYQVGNEKAHQIFNQLDVVKLKLLPPEHGRENVVRVVDDAKPLDQALLPTRKLAGHQKVLLVARIERALQETVL